MTGPLLFGNHNTEKCSFLHLKRNLILVAAAVFIDIFLYFGMEGGSILTSSDSVLPVIFSVLVVNFLLLFPFITKSETISFYVISYLALNIVLLTFFIGELTAYFILIPAAALCFSFIFLLDTEQKSAKVLSLFIILVLMYSLGKMFVFGPQPAVPIMIIESLYDAGSQSIINYGGLILISRYGDVFTGPFPFFIFLVTSSFVVENYYRIFRLLRRKTRALPVSAGTGPISTSTTIIGALGCQCESAIALFPAAAIFLLSTLLIPFLILSISLLAASYLMITRFYERNLLPPILRPAEISMPSKTILFSSILIVSQILIVFGIFFRLQMNPFFIFGTGMVMALNGFLVYYLVRLFFPARRLGRLYSTLVLFTSLALYVIWFLPLLTGIAVRNPLVFSLMSYSSFLSGFLISYVYFSSGPLYGKALTDVYVVVLGVIPVIIYYFTFSTGRAIWNFWTVPQQAELAIMLWIIMLPVMWYSTQKSLAVELPKGRDVQLLYSVKQD